MLWGGGFAHKQTAVEKRQKGKYAETGVHMDAQANAHAGGHVYTDAQAYDAHARTTLRLYQVSLCLAGMRVRLSEL